MAEKRTFHERLVDLVVFVPIGIAVSVAEELPSFAGKGRERLVNQLQVARLIGKFTVGEAQRRARKMAPEEFSSATSEQPVGQHTPNPGAGAARTSRVPVAPKTDLANDDWAPDAVPRGTRSRPAPPERTPEVASLPIPGYDTLAASQVVQRLSSLRPEELDAVRRYEVATRGRRTILHRIGQLSSPDSRASA
ncbi:MAG: hypothetical protein ACYCSF_10110 [Acidimicrobiales bacterium]